MCLVQALSLHYFGLPRSLIIMSLIVANNIAHEISSPLSMPLAASHLSSNSDELIDLNCRFAAIKLPADLQTPHIVITTVRPATTINTPNHARRTRKYGRPKALRIQSESWHNEHHLRTTRKEVRAFTLDHEDFQEIADDYEGGNGTHREQGLIASSVGLRLCLVKNEGILNVKYKGESGGLVNWTLNGMHIIAGCYMMASALTQTANDLHMCRDSCESVQAKLSLSTVQAISVNPIIPQTMGCTASAPNSTFSTISGISRTDFRHSDKRGMRACLSHIRH